MKLSPEQLEFRKQLARQLLSLDRTSLDDAKYVDEQLLAADAALTAQWTIDFPAGTAPKPERITPKPAPGDALPLADVVVVTWTVAENDALADIFTPGFSRNVWYRYDRNYQQIYEPQIRNGAPAKNAKRIGSYFMTKIKNKKVLCFKSELHLNQDGIQNYNGTDQTSLPVRDLFRQIISETKCKLILTVGTCGGVRKTDDLGDVLVTRGARFRCAREFDNAPFNRQTYTSNWVMKTDSFAKAEQLMVPFAEYLKEPAFGPPTVRHQGGNWTLPAPYSPVIIHDKGTGRRQMPEAHPILTTDFFEFGHSGNEVELWADGCGVEMGDAVLGLVCKDDIPNPPKWAVVRNLSDPQINGNLPPLRKPVRSINMQAMWAVWYYETYGYFTSVMSSLATWAIIVDNDV